MSLKPVNDEEREQWRKTAELLIEHGGPGWHWTERQLRLLADLERVEELVAVVFKVVETEPRGDHTHRVRPVYCRRTGNKALWIRSDPPACHHFTWPHAWEPNLAEAFFQIQEQKDGNAPR